MSNFDSELLPLNCPECFKEFRKAFTWLRTNASLTCNCGFVMEFDFKQFQEDLTNTKGFIKKCAPGNGPKLSI